MKKKFVLIVLCAITVIILLIGYHGLPEQELPLTEPDLTKVIKGAEPVFFKGNSGRAVLLIHGFRSTPQSLKYLGRKLNQNGYTVYIPLLPGHGVSYDYFAKSRFYHYYKITYKKALEIRNRHQNFYIIGLSMGGALTLKLLEELPEHLLPDAAVIISAPVFLNKISLKLFHIYDIKLFFTGIMKIFIKRMPDPFPSKEEFEIVPQIAYQGFHILACVHSLQKGLRIVAKNLSSVKTPILILQAEGDKIVPDINLDYIYNHISSGKKEKHFFDLSADKISKRHAITLNRYIKEEVAEKIIGYLLKY